MDHSSNDYDVGQNSVEECIWETINKYAPDVSMQGRVRERSTHGDPKAEYNTVFEAGIVGVFTDFANTGYEARTAYLASIGN